ncbi:MAG TPA: PAS domain S-box protein [Candidatus Binatia bacterium]|nr:PAS domain S-box protein [Candidatus Binatia bacterium]
MMGKLTAWGRRLTEPRTDLPLAEKRQAQFLASLLLFFLCAGLILLAAALALVSSSIRLNVFGSMIAILALFAPLYALSRSSYYHLAAIFSSYALNALLLVVALCGASEPLLVAALVIPLLLGSVLLSLRASAVLAATTAAVLALAMLAGDEPLALLRPLSFYTMTAGLVLLSAYQRQQLHAEQEAGLRESEMRFRTLSEKALVGVYITQDSLFRYVNPAMAMIFGYRPDEIVDRLGPLDLTMPVDQEMVSEHVRERLSGKLESAHYFLRGRRKDGSEVTCEVLGRTMEYHGQPALIGMLIDITERRRIETAEREQRALLEALRDTAATLNSTLDLDQVLERILDNVGRVVPHDGANIMLKDGDLVHVVRCQGHYATLGVADKVMQLTFDIDEAVNFKTMGQTGRPYVVYDTERDPQWREYPETSWIRSYIGAPISRGDEVIGFLNLDSMSPGFFTEAHAERLMAFADQVAIAMSNARLYQELESYNEALEQAVATRTVELRRTTEQVEAILTNSPDAVFLLRTDGSVRVANPAFYEMFGYQEQEVLERPLPRLVSPAGEECFHQALDGMLRRGKRSRLELAAQRKDGSTFDADLALAPVVDDGIVRGGVCSLHDISRLKEVDRMKDSFVSNVSHELRTPITSLRLYHDLLRRNPAKRDVYLERQEREIERLNTIIEDLLRLSRLDRGQLDMSLEPVSLNELVSEFILDRKPLAVSEGLELCWEPWNEPLMVRADRGLLEQVVSIILTNAINYTAPASTVKASTARQRRDGHDWATCSIYDGGPGIASEEMPLLFDRFFRGMAARASGTPGTGLGLSIAREIMERHEGFIEVSNKSGEETGTVFTVWIPTAEP